MVTCTGANYGLSSDCTTSCHGDMFEGTAELRTEPSCTRAVEKPIDAATLTKVSNMATTACMACSSAKMTE